MREIESSFWVQQMKKYLDGYAKHKDPEFLSCVQTRLSKLRTASERGMKPIFTPDDTVFVLGGGPSLKDMDLEKIKSYPVIGTNASVFLGDWVDIVFFGDERFYSWHPEALENFSNRVITCAVQLKNHQKFEYLEKVPASEQTKKADPIVWNKKKIAWFTNKGGNAGSSAVALACKMGAKQIILLGFDFKTKEGRHNYHDYHNHTPDKNIYQNEFLTHFKRLAEETERLGIQVINATPDSALDVFPKKTLEEVV